MDFGKPRMGDMVKHRTWGAGKITEEGRTAHGKPTFFIAFDPKLDLPRSACWFGERDFGTSPFDVQIVGRLDMQPTATEQLQERLEADQTLMDELRAMVAMNANMHDIAKAVMQRSAHEGLDANEIDWAEVFDQIAESVDPLEGPSL
jgi:hypothetical protein